MNMSLCHFVLYLIAHKVKYVDRISEKQAIVFSTFVSGKSLDTRTSVRQRQVTWHKDECSSKASHSAHGRVFVSGKSLGTRTSVPQWQVTRTRTSARQWQITRHKDECSLMAGLSLAHRRSVVIKKCKIVIVTPVVYPRLLEFLHFDIQSTGQKSHCVNNVSGHCNAFFSKT